MYRFYRFPQNKCPTQRAIRLATTLLPNGHSLVHREILLQVTSGKVSVVLSTKLSVVSGLIYIETLYLRRSWCREGIDGYIHTQHLHGAYYWFERHQIIIFSWFIFLFTHTTVDIKGQIEVIPVDRYGQNYPNNLSTSDIASVAFINWTHANSPMSHFPVVLRRNRSKTFQPFCSPYMTTKPYYPKYSIQNWRANFNGIILVVSDRDTLLSSFKFQSAVTKPPCTY